MMPPRLPPSPPSPHPPSARILPHRLGQIFRYYSGTWLYSSSGRVYQDPGEWRGEPDNAGYPGIIFNRCLLPFFRVLVLVGCMSLPGVLCLILMLMLMALSANCQY